MSSVVLLIGTFATRTIKLDSVFSTVTGSYEQATTAPIGTFANGYAQPQR
jgi:hypothetical protein